MRARLLKSNPCCVVDAATDCSDPDALRSVAASPTSSGPYDDAKPEPRGLTNKPQPQSKPQPCGGAG